MPDLPPGMTATISDDGNISRTVIALPADGSMGEETEQALKDLLLALVDAEPADWPDSDSPIDSPDRDQECAGCASLQVEVSALQVEVETLTGTLRDHQQMLADINARLSAQEWEQVRGAQGSARRKRSRLADSGAITTESN